MCCQTTQAAAPAAEPCGSDATVRDGVIAESHHYFDMNTIVDQLKS